MAMTQYEQKLIFPLYNMIRGKSSAEAIRILWRQGLLDRKGMERGYFVREVARRVREGEMKSLAITNVAIEARCSYEKVRRAVYETEKENKKRVTNGDKN